MVRMDSDAAVLRPSQMNPAVPARAARWPGGILTPPLSVNLMALPSRFIRQPPCRKRGSVWIVCGIAVVHSQSSRRSFAWAETRIVESTFERISCGEQRDRVHSIRPASILERSRMSLISVSRCRPLASIVSRYSSRRCGDPKPRRRTSVKPSIPLSGVRISWLMCARNSLLAALAASACSLAARSWAWFHSSCTVCAASDRIFAHRLPDNDDQEQVLEENPTRLFQPPPGADGGDAENRFRTEHAANEMIDRHDNRRRNQHLPIPIGRQERQRTEHVKVRFDPAAANVWINSDEKTTCGNSDRVPRDRLAGRHDRQRDGQAAQDSAKNKSQPDVRVNAAVDAGPRPR